MIFNIFRESEIDYIFIDSYNMLEPCNDFLSKYEQANHVVLLTQTDNNTQNAIEPKLFT